MQSKTEKVIIGKDGVVRGIHGPLVDAVTKKLGDPQIMRASHVEPGSELSQAALVILYNDNERGEFVIPMLPGDSGATPAPGSCVVYRANRKYATKWFADMTPIKAEVVLGPFETREEALTEEVNWLKVHNIPVCHPCRAGGGT